MAVHHGEIVLECIDIDAGRNCVHHGVGCLLDEKLAAGFNPDPVILAAATSKRGSLNHVVLYALKCKRCYQLFFGW
jgi:hypothetical protein